MSRKVTLDDVVQIMNQRFDALDQRFIGIDGRLDGIDGRLDGIDGRLDGIDTRLDRLEMAVANHDNKLGTFLTRDEFTRFRVENLHFQHKLTQKWEDMEEAFRDSQRLQRRLELKVKKHEQVLVENHLLLV